MRYGFLVGFLKATLMGFLSATFTICLLVCSAVVVALIMFKLRSSKEAAPSKDIKRGPP